MKVSWNRDQHIQPKNHRRTLQAEKTVLLENQANTLVCKQDPRRVLFYANKL